MDYINIEMRNIKSELYLLEDLIALVPSKALKNNIRNRLGTVKSGLRKVGYRYNIISNMIDNLKK